MESKKSPKPSRKLSKKVKQEITFQMVNVLNRYLDSRDYFAVLLYELERKGLKEAFLTKEADAYTCPQNLLCAANICHVDNNCAMNICNVNGVCPKDGLECPTDGMGCPTDGWSCPHDNCPTDDVCSADV
jgi:hypothetical protein